MPILLGDFLDRHLEAILVEDTCLARQRQRRKAGPSRDSDADLHVVGGRGCRHQESNDCRECSGTTHDCLPLATMDSVWSVQFRVVERLHEFFCMYWAASCAQ